MLEISVVSIINSKLLLMLRMLHKRY